MAALSSGPIGHYRGVPDRYPVENSLHGLQATEHPHWIESETQKEIEGRRRVIHEPRHCIHALVERAH
ncbi:MAG TPA: hypothetical protein VMG08_19340 [Allosphingosinicella sp.]|nr:hypothetical protein [Allosphingosinicella sp.]